MIPINIDSLMEFALIGQSFIAQGTVARCPPKFAEGGAELTEPNSSPSDTRGAPYSMAAAHK